MLAVEAMMAERESEEGSSSSSFLSCMPYAKPKELSCHLTVFVITLQHQPQLQYFYPGQFVL